MMHCCKECLHEFSDDGGPLPYRDRVHCVACGAPILLPRPPAHTELPPFSNEAAREADFALGVLSNGGAGFPDTLRQFRIRQGTLSRRPSNQGMDSLAPLADLPQQPLTAAPSPWFGTSFWASLGVGFAVGALIALGASWSKERVKPPSSAISRGPVAQLAVVSAASSVAPVPSTLGLAPVAAPSVAAPTAAKEPRRFDAMAERRFALERARAEQRHYHLAEAEQLYRRALQFAPHDSEALAGLGELELLRGTTDLAAARFRDALSANADYVPARVAVADLEWQAGHVEAARRAYREIVDSYAPDMYPPYVAQRSVVGEPANCDE